MGLRGTGSGGSLARTMEAVSVLSSAGFLNPLFATALGRGVGRWGSTLAAGLSASAVRRPNDVGIIDDLGSITFGEIDSRSNAIANALAAAGVGAGDGVALLARNHRGFVQASVAINKLGANTLLLNTGFAAPQLSEVLDREQSRVIIYDEEFAGIVDAGAGSRERFVSWQDGDSSETTLNDLARTHSTAEPAPPASPGRTTVLTSGTTGTPKGAQRDSTGAGLDSLVGMFGRMPLQTHDTSFVVAPAFHSWGGAHLLLATLLSCKIVLRRRFDPEDTLATVDRESPRTMAVVPVMLQRMLALDDTVHGKYDTSSLKVVGSSGSALPGGLALQWMDTFGDNLVNFYGSTEVAQAAIATPDELRAAPGTAGRPPRGTTVRILDEDGKEVPHGTTGRIFVGNDAQFEGYTGGGGKEVIGGLMSSGDVGHFTPEGLLFVDGRDDDMIVSGGENVFPAEVEDLLTKHEAVAEAAVLGVPDEEFGQRLTAFVVLRPGHDVSEKEFQDYVRKHLARFKVPRAVDFMDELPSNPTGKVLKRVLKERV